VRASSSQVGGSTAPSAKKSSSAVSSGGAQAADPTNAAAADTQDASAGQSVASGDAGSLPFTGFVLLPMVGVGVLALLAGVALRIRVKRV
jgi:hypothetical protein